MDRASDAGGVSRRGLLGAGAAGLATPLGGGKAAAETTNAAAGDVDMSLTVNGRPRAFSADVRTTLLDVLREKLGLTGAKKGCDHGQCGACTVLMDGRTRLSCLTLAVAARDAAIVTIEGLAAADGALSPMQAAFVRHDAFQCGYCTPGQILAAEACVREGHAASDAAIAEYMSGNICRCGAYPHIVRAIAEAAGRA